MRTEELEGVDVQLHKTIPVIYGKSFDENLAEIQSYLKTVIGPQNVGNESLGIIAQAFTTLGYSNEHHGFKNYQRLEFLGDALIKAHISKTIFHRYPDMDEGRMSKICQNLWNDKTYPYCLLQSGMDFHHLILLPKSEENQDFKHRVDYITSVVQDCFEAFIGALELTCKPEIYTNLIDNVLLEDIDSLVHKVSQLDIKQWDKCLNDLAEQRITSYKEWIGTCF